MNHTLIFTNLGEINDHQFAFSEHKLSNTALLAIAKRSMIHSIVLAVQQGKIIHQSKVAIKYLSPYVRNWVS
jgi:hypothetical protein